MARAVPVQALQHAGIGVEPEQLAELDLARCGILIGTAMGGMSTFSTAVEDLMHKARASSSRHALRHSANHVPSKSPTRRRARLRKGAGCKRVFARQAPPWLLEACVAASCPPGQSATGTSCTCTMRVSSVEARMPGSCDRYL